MKIPGLLRTAIAILLPVLFCLWLRYDLLKPLADGSTGRTGLVRELASVHEFTALLDISQTDLEALKARQAVPALNLVNLPIDLNDLSKEEKTTCFIAMVLPQILRVNEEIRTQRAHLLKLIAKRAQHRKLTARERWWLNRIARKYGCDPDDAGELMRRVEIVPVGLALAQAILESGWGTSRFALKGNALYGQHLSADGEGDFIVSRRGGVKVAAFGSLYDSTRSYIHSLNSIRAYRKFREIRSARRGEGVPLTGFELATGLNHYSELGQGYVHNLQTIIRLYELDRFNGVTLEMQEPVRYKFKRPVPSG